MSTDRHFVDPENQAAGPGKCKHCGKPMKQWWKFKYGSNACRQAAYRARLAKFLPRKDKASRPGQYGHKQGRRRKEHAPPSEGKIIGARDRRRGVTPTGKVKGGAA